MGNRKCGAEIFLWTFSSSGLHAFPDKLTPSVVSVLSYGQGTNMSCLLTVGKSNKHKKQQWSLCGRILCSQFIPQRQPRVGAHTTAHTVTQGWPRFVCGRKGGEIPAALSSWESCSANTRGVWAITPSSTWERTKLCSSHKNEKMSCGARVQSEAPE